MFIPRYRYSGGTLGRLTSRERSGCLGERQWRRSICYSGCLYCTRLYSDCLYNSGNRRFTVLISTHEMTAAKNEVGSRFDMYNMVRSVYIEMFMKVVLIMSISSDDDL